MTITKYAEHVDLTAVLAKGEPFLAVISFDGERAYMAHIDEAMEHHILERALITAKLPAREESKDTRSAGCASGGGDSPLLAKVGLAGTDIDKYFRIVFDDEGADWTFVCPPDYKNITDRSRRVTEFYKDGFTVISRFLSELGLLVDIRIPKRYRRHVEAMKS